MSEEKIIGIVAEYNPFHKGHAYQISAAKKALGASAVIAVMSGNFTQRGEIALWDKWQRTELALAGGVDLVLELPTIYALRSSEIFGARAVELLAATGVVTDLVFGCETTEPEILADLARKKVAKNDLLPFLEKGLTYGAAMCAFLSASSPQAKTLLKTPNNILAFSYYQALQRLPQPLRPFPVVRKGTDYRDNVLTQALPSAQALRTELCSRGFTEKARAGFPASVLSLAEKCWKMNTHTLNEAALFILLKHELYTTTADALTLKADFTEGLEYKFLAGAKTASLADFWQGVKSRRYPLTRLQRLTYQLLLSESATPFGATKNLAPSYLRILGFSPKGQELLKKMKKTATLPLLTKLHKNELQNASLAFAQSLALDIGATNLYDLLKGINSYNRDYVTGPVIVK